MLNVELSGLPITAVVLHKAVESFPSVITNYHVCWKRLPSDER